MIIKKGHMPFSFWRYPDGHIKYEVVDASPAEIEELKKELRPEDILIEKEPQNNSFVDGLL